MYVEPVTLTSTVSLLIIKNEIIQAQVVLQCSIVLQLKEVCND